MYGKSVKSASCISAGLVTGVKYIPFIKAIMIPRKKLASNSKNPLIRPGETTLSWYAHQQLVYFQVYSLQLKNS